MDFVILALLFAQFSFLECFIWILKKKVDSKKGKILDKKYIIIRYLW